MSIKREHWRKWHEPKKFPPWPCPTCDAGTLSLDPPTWFHRQAQWDVARQQEIWWEPDMMRRSASALLICQNQACGEVVSMGGDLVPHEDPDIARQIMNYLDLFAPRTFHPAPCPIRLHPQCPTSVAVHVRRAAAAYSSDRRAVMGALRSAVEALLTDKRVPRFAVVPAKSAKKGRRTSVALHKRIEKFGEKNATASETLMAVKWLGNSGAHDGSEPERRDVLDAFELVDHVIDIVYLQKAAAIAKKAAIVNKRKGRPLRKRR